MRRITVNQRRKEFDKNMRHLRQQVMANLDNNFDVICVETDERLQREMVELQAGNRKDNPMPDSMSDMMLQSYA